jgi:hypothetical protein
MDNQNFRARAGFPADLDAVHREPTDPAPLY